MATRPLAGLRVVLHESNRRGAVLRCLSSVRWLSLHGAEVLLVDGVAGRGSSDGTRTAVERRFPAVDVVTAPQRGGLRAMLGVHVAPTTGTAPGPHTVLHLCADLEVDRFRVEALLEELGSGPQGTVLVPRWIQSDGRPLPGPEPTAAGRSESLGTAGAWPKAWMARSSDLDAGGSRRGWRFVASAVSLVAPLQP